jgi:hypothetical protein
MSTTTPATTPQAADADARLAYVLRHQAQAKPREYVSLGDRGQVVRRYTIPATPTTSAAPCACGTEIFDHPATQGGRCTGVPLDTPTSATTLPPVHKATPAPQFAEDASSTCIHCHSDIRRVPGGSGPVWVHTNTGTVAGPGAPSGQAVTSEA